MGSVTAMTINEAMLIITSCNHHAKHATRRLRVWQEIMRRHPKRNIPAKWATYVVTVSGVPQAKRGFWIAPSPGSERRSYERTGTVTRCATPS